MCRIKKKTTLQRAPSKRQCCHLPVSYFRFSNSSLCVYTSCCHMALLSLPNAGHSRKRKNRNKFHCFWNTNSSNFELLLFLSLFVLIFSWKRITPREFFLFFHYDKSLFSMPLPENQSRFHIFIFLG